MRTLMIVEFVTLDGVMQGFSGPDQDDPGFRHGGWGLPYADPVAQQSGIESQNTTTAYLFGRKTYQLLAAFWPHQPRENAMAAHLNDTPKYVATRTLTSFEWPNSSRLEGELAPAVRALKESGEGTVAVLGSGALTRQLVAEGLVDAYTLFVHPLLLGSGERLFHTLDKPIPLRFQDVTTTDTGVLIVNYTVQ
ncbi:dihydrofolate reductase family protein [Planobispora siamensis]|uniref:Deaminase reductase n=1 Tax=Planobispora siamensis TaxID=936338 RepID=A0A8J3SNZ1_9ACTN|nr:dihydrofolate reductase family protein [Planobispora siamensis]GIH96719.1 deaminase reductase [Planobispora siamensis]